MDRHTMGALALAAFLPLAPAEVAGAPETRCLPPGVALEALTWQTVSAQTIAIPTESGVERAGLLEIFRAEDGRAVVIVWVRGDIVYVDTAPGNPRLPAWVDAGLMSVDGKVLREVPGAACQWRMLGGSSASREPSAPPEKQGPLQL